MTAVTGAVGKNTEAMSAGVWAMTAVNPAIRKTIGAGI